MSTLAMDRGSGIAGDPEFLKSGMSARAAAGEGLSYLPISLESVQVRALAGIPVYLSTGQGPAQNFAAFCAESARFTNFHRQRLLEASVRFLYIPAGHFAKYQHQVETELESLAVDASISTGTKCETIYQAGLEALNEIFSEQKIGRNFPRLERVARAAAGLVAADEKAFAGFFSMAHHDFYTATHALNVGLGMVSLAFAMGIREKKELELACLAGMLHDIGKLLVPGKILDKLGHLSEGEWSILREHAARGAEYLKREGVAGELIIRVAHEHHERMDGSGYPRQLSGESIHRVSRICAVVDSFDAMTSCRSFKNNVKAPAEALSILRGEAPLKYDAEIVRAWAELLKNADAQGIGAASVGADKLGRRAHERFTIDCPVELRRLTNQEAAEWIEGAALEGKAHNFSEVGLGILVNRQVSINGYVRIYLRGGKLQNRIVEGYVVRCRAYEDGCYEVGIRLCTPGLQEQASARVIAQKA